MNPCPINWDCPIETRDGSPVRILATDLPGEEPVIGIVGDSYATQRWRRNGCYLPSGADHELDLFNAGSAPPSACLRLTQDDIVPGSVFRLKREPTTILWPLWASPWGMCFGDRSTASWEDILCHYEIQFPDEDWQPCQKP